MKELKKILLEKGFEFVQIKPYNKTWKRMVVGAGLYKEGMEVAKKAEITKNDDGIGELAIDYISF